MGLWSKLRSYEGENVLVSGGSTGIGFALAEEFIKLGANVILVARTQSKLDKAKADLQELVKASDLPGRVLTISADVSVSHEVQRVVKASEGELGPISVAVSAAGAAYPGRFVEQDLKDFEKSMQLDYFGSLYLAKAVLPGMLKRDSGQILFIASPLALAGIVGYASYAPAKAAVRSLADVLRNELVGTGVKISIGYPLDTDTPGFANENLTKPSETEAISRAAAGPVYPPQTIAKGLIQGLRKEHYHIKTPEFIMNLLISSAASITPRPFFVLLEMLWAPLLVAILAIAGKLCDGIVKKERLKSQSQPHSVEDDRQQ